jgi:hypothetical protein
MLTALFVLAVLVTLVSLLHYEVLRWLDTFLVTLRIPPRSKLLVSAAVTLAAHALEAGLYAVGLWTLADVLHVGSLDPAQRQSGLDFLYFSLETYSSLGFGDLTPRGPLRIVAGLEALHGLLLIGWSASFLHLAMERYWGSHRPVRSPGPASEGHQKAPRH